LACAEDTRVTAYPIKHTIPCFAFVITENPKRGKADITKAAALGLKGKMIGECIANGSIRLPDGTVVTSDQVCIALPNLGRDFAEQHCVNR
jgi:ribonuclease BN (tRNA processing enzyme)